MADVNCTPPSCPVEVITRNLLALWQAVDTAPAAEQDRAYDAATAVENAARVLRAATLPGVASQVVLVMSKLSEADIYEMGADELRKLATEQQAALGRVLQALLALGGDTPTVRSLVGHYIGPHWPGPAQEARSLNG